MENSNPSHSPTPHLPLAPISPTVGTHWPHHRPASSQLGTFCNRLQSSVWALLMVDINCLASWDVCHYCFWHQMAETARVTYQRKDGVGGQTCITASAGGVWHTDLARYTRPLIWIVIGAAGLWGGWGILTECNSVITPRHLSGSQIFEDIKDGKQREITIQAFHKCR